MFESLGVVRSSSFPTDKFQITREHLDIPCQVMEFMGFGATKAPKGRGNSMGTTPLTFNDWNLKKRNTISCQCVQQWTPFFHSFPGIELSMILKIFDDYYWKLHVMRYEPSAKRLFHTILGCSLLTSIMYMWIHSYIHASVHIFHSARKKQS